MNTPSVVAVNFAKMKMNTISGNRYMGSFFIFIIFFSL